MKPKLKKTLKITVISLFSIVFLFLIAVAVLINFIFTPAKLTPLVLKTAEKQLNAKLSMESVDLTFFSTFPELGIRLKEGMLISKAIHDEQWTKQDSLLSFKECIIEFNPVAYIKAGKISVHNIIIEQGAVYAFKNAEGKSNWDIMKAVTDTIASDTDTPLIDIKELEIKNIDLRKTNLTFDDQDTKIYARLDEANLNLKLLITKEKADLKIAFDNKNTVFSQEGKLLVNEVAAAIITDVQVERSVSKYTFQNTKLTVNGIELSAQGTAARDTIAKTVDVDIQYGLHAPSIETVLGMIPETIIKKTEVSGKGEVTARGTVKGLYGGKQVPVITLKSQIKKASVKYVGLPYGIDDLTANADASIDVMNKELSYINLDILNLKAVNTNIVADIKIKDPLTDPDIVFNTKSKINLDALAKTFPLQKGVSITGNMDADLHLKCRLSSIKKQDIGRIKVKGKLDLTKFGLKVEKENFDFSGNASLKFEGDNTLQAYAVIKNITLNTKSLTSTIENLSGEVTSTNPKDTTRIADVQTSFSMRKLKAKVGDSIVLFSASTKVNALLGPQPKDVKKPHIDVSFRTDSLYAALNDTKAALSVAGFKITAKKIRDSVWEPEGIVGFSKLYIRTPKFKLPIVVQKTKVTFFKEDITLQDASMKIGTSNMTVSGVLYNAYTATMKKKELRAKLNVYSDKINCNELIQALPEEEEDDSIETGTEFQTAIAKTDTLSSGLKLFVVPKNIDFELNTNIKELQFDKMVFNDIDGVMNIKNQGIYLEKLNMRAMDADMSSVLVYKARKGRRAYTGFDFKIKDIDISKLVDFMPSLDTLVPMLRSFKGQVDFDVVSEFSLDSKLNVRIPTLKSAINIKGNNLVLMDGETFAEISKKLWFKNKKRNMIDDIYVNITVSDGNVKVYPFLLEIDRYKVAIGGQQDLNMKFDYHISVLKSPIPFKLGVNISGTLDKMKIGLGKAKYKNAITPVEIRKVDSTRTNMGNLIANRFKQIIAR